MIDFKYIHDLVQSLFDDIMFYLILNFNITQKH